MTGRARPQMLLCDPVSCLHTSPCELAACMHTTVSWTNVSSMPAVRDTSCLANPVIHNVLQTEHVAFATVSVKLPSNMVTSIPFAAARSDARKVPAGTGLAHGRLEQGRLAWLLAHRQAARGHGAHGRHGRQAPARQEARLQGARFVQTQLPAVADVCSGCDNSAAGSSAVQTLLQHHLRSMVTNLYHCASCSCCLVAAQSAMSTIPCVSSVCRDLQSATPFNAPVPLSHLLSAGRQVVAL